MRDFIQTARTFGLGTAVKGIFVEETPEGGVKLKLPGWVISLWAVACYLTGFEVGIWIVAILLWGLTIFVGFFGAFLLIGLLRTVSGGHWGTVTYDATKARDSHIEMAWGLPTVVVLWLSGWTTLVIAMTVTFIIFALATLILHRILRRMDIR